MQSTPNVRKNQILPFNQDAIIFENKLKELETQVNKYSHYSRTYKALAIVTDDIERKKQHYERRKYFYYKTVSLITDQYRLVVEFFDGTFVVNGSVTSPYFQKLIDLAYTNTFDLEKDIENSKITELTPTEEEQNIINNLLQQLLQTRSLFEPYVQKKQHIQNCVNKN